MAGFFDEMATREDVKNAYRFILGREPENDAVIDSRAGNITLNQLRAEFFQSAEFSSNALCANCVSRIATDNQYAPQQIEYQASEDQLKEILSHIESVWSAYGENNAYWSVLTAPEFMKNNLTDESIEIFFKTGEDTMRLIELALSRCDRWGGGGFRQKKALEYGCGVGRVTLQLAKYFKRVVGMDISQAHLDLAGAMSNKTGAGNLELVKINNFKDINIGEKFDFIFSVIVLQHNPPPIIASLIDLFFKLLAPEGVAMFQVPTRIDGYSFCIDNYINAMSSVDTMEIHALPQSVIFSIAERNNCMPLEAQCDRWNGASNVVSQTFVFTKKLV